MQRLVLLFCILALSSVSHISAQTSCTTSEQCTDAEIAPICRDGVCSACNESLSEECFARSPNAPICSLGGCYPCLTSGDYAPECGVLYPATPICSNDTGACRACTADSECGIYGETIQCQNGSCIGLDSNSGLIIAVCFIAAIVAVIIALILYARLRKKKDKKGTTSANNAANNANNNNASVKGSVRTSGTNKDVPMTEITKEPMAVDDSDSRDDSSDSNEGSSSSKSRSVPQKSASERSASSEESSESEESAEDSSESSSASSSEGAQQSSAASSAQSSS